MRARRYTPSLQEIIVTVGVGAFLLTIATIRTPLLHGVGVSAATSTATSTLVLQRPTYYSSERPSSSVSVSASSETDKKNRSLLSSSTTAVNGTNTYFENPVVVDGDGVGYSSTKTGSNEVSVSLSLALPEEWNLSYPQLKGAKDILLEVVATAANELFVLSLYHSIHVVMFQQDHHITNETETTIPATTTTSSSSNQLFEEWITGKQAETEPASRSSTTSSNILQPTQQQQQKSPVYGYGRGDGSGYNGGGYGHNDDHDSEGSSGSENDYGFGYGNSEAGGGSGSGSGNGGGGGNGNGNGNPNGYGYAYGQPQDQHPDEVWHLFLSKISYNLVVVHDNNDNNQTYSWWQITLTYPVFVNASAMNGAVGTAYDKSGGENNESSSVDWAPVCQQGILEFITRLLQQELDKAIQSGTFLSNMQDIAFLYDYDATPLLPVYHGDPDAEVLFPDHHQHHHIVYNVLAMALPGSEYVVVLDDDGEVIEQQQQKEEEEEEEEEEQVPGLEATAGPLEVVEEVVVIDGEDDQKEDSMIPDTESSATMPPSPELPFQPDRLGTYSRSILDDEPDHHYELRLKVGLWVLISTSALVGSMVVLSLSRTAVAQYLERQAQVDDTWKLATEEDVDEILNIGWRQYVMMNSRGGENNATAAEVLEVVDKTGVGYRDGDSMLHGSAFL